MDPVTNTETGFFRPLPLQNDSLIVFKYSGKGFLPVMISNHPIEGIKAIKYLGQEVVKNNPIVKSWKIDPPSPQLIDLDTLIISSGRYSGIKYFNLAGIYPIVEGFKEYPAYGFRMNIYDPLLLQGINLSTSYTPNKLLPENERVHLYLKYSYWNWNFTATYNKADFYDLFGPTKISRKGYSAGIRYSDYLVYAKPKLLNFTLNLSGYGGLERLPDYQNIAASFDKFVNLGSKLEYSYLLKSLGAVEYEQGVQCGVSTSGNYVNNKLYARLHSNFDCGFLLPIDHSSIWFRTYAGYSFGEREEPFANYYFGGFGNNWVDYKEISRYREYYSFPGVELNHINGTNFGKVIVEWTIPPLRFRQFGIPSFYFRWARLALFSSAIMTNIDDKTYSKSFVNIGSQLDIRIVTFTHLNSTFSIGYAISFEKSHRLNKEFMVSLKIM